MRCAVTFAMSVSVPDPTETSSRCSAHFGHRALDGFLVGANRPRAELDDRAAELPGEPIHDRPGRRAVRPAVAEDHRLFRDESCEAGADRTVQHRRADADVDVGQSGVTVGAQGRRGAPRGRER